MPAMQHDQGSAALPEPGGGQGLRIAPPPRTADRMGGRSGGDAGTNGNGVEVRYSDGLVVTCAVLETKDFRVNRAIDRREARVSWSHGWVNPKARYCTDWRGWDFLRFS